MPKCNTENCELRAYYGYKFREPLKCKDHRLKPEMIHVLHPKCVCGKARPIFGLITDEKATCCIKCKTEDMIDIKNDKCKCKKGRPTFGLESNMKAICCKLCRTDIMIDVLHKNLCKCGKQMTFGLEKGSPTACVNCKTPEMNDVVSNLCICGKRPVFGLNDNKPICCSDCKTPEMNDVKSFLCKCGKHPTFALEGCKPVCCFDCKTSEMTNIRQSRCLTENCDTHISNKKYRGYCSRCFMYTFPDEPIARNYKTKEASVAEYIKSIYPKLNIIWDKRIVNGKSLRRPDFQIHLPNQVIIIEVDENQHKKYDCSCDNSRLMEISKDLNHKSIVFIRFNPDKYIDKNDKKIKSCWSVTPKTGMIKVYDKKIWNNRLECLKIQIDYWLKNDTDKIIETIQLYYDGFT